MFEKFTEMLRSLLGGGAPSDAKAPAVEEANTDPLGEPESAVPPLSTSPKAKSRSPNPPSMPPGDAPSPGPATPPRRSTVTKKLVAAKKTPARKGKPRKRRPRRYHLGLDWGTSTTKLVLRDYDDPGSDDGRAYVVRTPGGSYRYPSTVTLEAGRIWFGVEAERRRGQGRSWDSLKALGALKARWRDLVPDLEGLTHEDLATLVVAHQVARGLEAASAHAATKGAVPRLGMTLSVPVASLTIPQSQEAYLRVATRAFEIGARAGLDPQGWTLERSAEAITAAADAAPDADDVAYDTYLRAEVVAAMVWPCMSPSLKEGPYTVVDIGAATTNANWFRIHSRRDHDGELRQKAGLSFFGAVTRAPGMDAFDDVLARALGKRVPATLRGHEAELVQMVSDDSELDQVSAGFYETWAKARRKAFFLADRMRHWEHLSILVVGGGSKVTSIRERFGQLPGAFREGIKNFKMLKHPGTPSDLFELEGGRRFADDPTFLLVAYGLSYTTLDLPEVTLPSGIRPFRQEEFVRAFRSSEELGYADK